MIKLLEAQGYPSDPVKAWKKSLSTDEEEEEREEEGEEGGGGEEKLDYNYLLSMQLWSLTREKKEELLKSRDKKVCVCVCMCACVCMCTYVCVCVHACVCACRSV